jgi:hypothetical protein
VSKESLFSSVRFDRFGFTVGPHSSQVLTKLYVHIFLFLKNIVQAFLGYIQAIYSLKVSFNTFLVGIAELSSGCESRTKPPLGFQCIQRSIAKVWLLLTCGKDTSTLGCLGHPCSSQCTLALSSMEAGHNNCRIYIWCHFLCVTSSRVYYTPLVCITTLCLGTVPR